MEILTQIIHTVVLYMDMQVANVFNSVIHYVLVCIEIIKYAYIYKFLPPPLTVAITTLMTSKVT